MFFHTALKVKILQILIQLQRGQWVYAAYSSMLKGFFTFTTTIVLACVRTTTTTYKVTTTTVVYAYAYAWCV